MILILAANTAFADLPVLASVMARDRVMPHHFLFRGDRLVFSKGVLLLGLAASGVLVLYGAETTRIIPLYAFGVFVAFTLSQYGMVAHWLRLREPGWRRSLLLSAVGGTVTLLVAGIVGLTKFEHGAWLSMTGIGLLVVVLSGIRRHYDAVESQLALPPDSRPYGDGATAPAHPRVMLLVKDVDRVSLKAAAYARSLSDEAWAVHICFGREEGEDVRRRWAETVPGMPMIVVEAPFRSLRHAIDAYLDSLRLDQDLALTVVIAEISPRRPWQRWLHGGSGSRLREVLQRRPGVVVVRVRY
jgi:hypothetical protein